MINLMTCKRLRTTSAAVARLDRDARELGFDAVTAIDPAWRCEDLSSILPHGRRAPVDVNKIGVIRAWRHSSAVLLLVRYMRSFALCWRGLADGCRWRWIPTDLGGRSRHTLGAAAGYSSYLLLRTTAQALGIDVVSTDPTRSGLCFDCSPEDGVIRVLYLFADSQNWLESIAPGEIRTPADAAAQLYVMLRKLRRQALTFLESITPAARIVESDLSRPARY